MFAEIILPIPLYSTFTYSVPEEFKHLLQPGSRVLVQFGKKKYYTGIVTTLHHDAPDYEVKPVSCMLDANPVLRYPQLKFWEWISEYYLCSAGEVMKAALPSGLKPESNTFVTLNPDYDSDGSVKISEREAEVVMLLEAKKKMSVSDIESELKFKNGTRIIQQMLDSGIVEVAEKVVETYRAKSETFIEITCERGDREQLHKFFDFVARSQLQEKALITYLDMSGWLHPKDAPADVTRSELLSRSGISASVLKSMISKGIFRLEKRVVNRFNKEYPDTPENLAQLSESQKEALHGIFESFNTFRTVLLHGVTGSGKTEIYTHLISRALADGNQVLYLVPEISLTTQLTDRLRKVFGNKLIVYHSRFSDNERVDIWKRMLDSSEPVVVLGARSSVFLPFSRIGLVIVDEEHESSFKQYDPAPRYNARDSAIMLAMMHGAKVMLGSATPSVETYYKATTGKYGLVELQNRYQGTSLPEVEIVDMREQRKKKLNNGILSSSLTKSVRDTIKTGKQAILFQNRRGFAPVVVCNQCGWTPKCENCDVSPVYHKHIGLLKCHYCGTSHTLPAICPACGQNSIEIYGYGTERVAEEIARIFPEAGISRMDLDTTRNKDSYQEIIEKFADRNTDILVGTQMVTKGLDFENVTTVGVINADTLLNFPDFRSNERAFNMLEQVSGRAGRRTEEGKVLIQTTSPQDDVLKFVKTHNYKGFYKSEIEEREKYNYPPFSKVINIYLRNKDSATLDRVAALYSIKLREIFGNRVFGPEKPFVSRVALWYIQSIMLRVEVGASMKKVKALLRKIYEDAAAWPDLKATQIYYDVDPA
ncbi:MAG: primosomal protein N' [Candidatus Amulumruptor caecigallinarius]|nr:primosomal protein N' [Candidatus Amulumruptor caecigallinarius]